MQLVDILVSIISDIWKNIDWSSELVRWVVFMPAKSLRQMTDHILIIHVWVAGPLWSKRRQSIGVVCHTYQIQ
jgi:hypothetical protein